MSSAIPIQLQGKTPSSGTAKLRDIDATGEATASLTPELVIALCGPIGSPLHETADHIENALRSYDYVVEKVRLSDFIRLNATVVSSNIRCDSKLVQAQDLIATGNRLREKFGNDVLAKIAIAKVRADRKKSYGDFQDQANEAAVPPASRISAHRICHVIDSIKNTAELDLLRLVYGDALFAIGVFSPLTVRRLNLSHSGVLADADINVLIDTDSGEEFDHGQSVRNTFPRCDFFLRVDSTVHGADDNAASQQLFAKLRRFFNLVFQSSVVTPTTEEAAMYAAASGARNSACFSRQVGAAVTSSTGEVLAVGWNDVPRSGGGLYGKPQLLPGHPTDATTDKRCYSEPGAQCFNDREKELVAEKVVGALVVGGIIGAGDAAQARQVILSDTRVKDLIEFSRAVHAEMHAILNASRLCGDKVVGGKVFVTTYPCHSCARHIVAAGVSEVVYIEPYRKSLATRLHEDSLSEDADAVGKVRLLQFDGIAPRRFIDLFEARDRKKGGVLNLRDKSHAVPTTQVSLKAIPRLEDVVVAEVTTNELVLPALASAHRVHSNE
ncbi:CMP deaminase [Lysobacteraceae bacterium NML91-0213]|nr:CMP deaminase [Xanthomonadaceae bacterium NML91-0213]